MMELLTSFSTKLCLFPLLTDRIRIPDEAVDGANRESSSDRSRCWSLDRQSLSHSSHRVNTTCLVCRRNWRSVVQVVPVMAIVVGITRFGGVARALGLHDTKCCSRREKKRSCGMESSGMRTNSMRTLISGSKRSRRRQARSFNMVSALHIQQQLPTFTREKFEEFLLHMQDSICNTVAEADGSGKAFCEDRWQRSEDPSSGYGITRVLEDGDLLEKAAANVSIVRGQLSEARAKAMSGRGRAVGSGAKYFAGALSLVFHTRHPFVPTFRSDVRYFEVEGGGGWFGGGADLTPSYLFEEDAEFFHSYYKTVCDGYDPTLYQQSKAACDAYFYIPARSEHRGIGGIFFDDLESFQLQEDSGLIANRSAVFSFVKDVAEGFMPSFLPIAQKRRHLSYGDKERQWQLLRRGRYLEFNLLYDRGVKFGLDGGRFESIMVSAPPLTAWRYNLKPQPGTAEAQMVEVLKSPRQWISE